VSDFGSRGRVLVTGGAGYLGTKLVQQLAMKGRQVVVLDDLSTGSWPPPDTELQGGVHLIQVDLRDRLATADAVRDANPELVFHLAALHFIPACVADPSRTLAINVLGTQHLLDGLAKLAEPPRVVFTSTADVYQPQLEPHREDSPVGPDNVYGLSKLVGEELMQQSRRKGQCHPIIARLFNLYGPGETNPHVIPEIVSQLRSGSTVRLGNITPRRDYVYVSDAARALLSLAHAASEGSIWNVGTGNSYSVQEVLDVMGGLLGHAIIVETDPDRYRKSDRPNLQSDPSAIRSLDASLLRTPINDGLKSLLIAEGLLTLGN
jgi:UDP-glucose 4-epimerase